VTDLPVSFRALADVGISFAYNPQGHGRWMSLNLKKRKKVGGKRRLSKVEVPHEEEGGEEGEDDGDVDMDDHDVSFSNTRRCS